MQSTCSDTLFGRSVGCSIADTGTVPIPARIGVSWASSEAEVRDAQRLRHQVFVQEMGATPSDYNNVDGSDLEADRFDPFCDHLLIKIHDPWEQYRTQIIGTCRVLRPAQAVLAGGFYSDTEFELSAIESLRPKALELGRTCVHPDWRRGYVIMTMWRALSQYMLRHQLDTLIGSASISLTDGGYAAAAIWERLRFTHLVDQSWQVAPLDPLPLDLLLAVRTRSMTARPIQTPPLIDGYLRCGAQLLGPPSRDVLFNTADLPIMLQFDALTPRYRKHFLGG